jgi:predicted deacylase
LIAAYASLVRDYPTIISNETVGNSVNGRTMYLFKIGNSEGGILYIDSAMHGSEYSPSEAVYILVLWIVTSFEPEAVRIRISNYVLVMPMVDIDNYRTSRYNANYVDINRNFELGWGEFNDPNKGPSPLSEPETRAVRYVLENYRPSWYITFHTGDYRVTPPWGYQSGTPELPYYKSVYDSYSALSVAYGLSVIPLLFRPNYGGGLSRDEGHSLGAFTFTVECSTSTTPSYSTLLNKMVPQMKALTVSIAMAAESKPHTSFYSVSPPASVAP